ncbi:MAG: TetR family transcriptional regulator [Reyranella sp.]|nr:TetR family transcriptional regulator [Reyranella sp.]
MRAASRRTGSTGTAAKVSGGKGVVRDAAATSLRIIEAATAEFAERGYEGARVERIVAHADCNMRMVYHYFESKEGLYSAVLESIYEDIRGKERQLALDHLEPVAGIAVLVDFTFSHFVENQTFVRLTLNENLQRGVHIARSRRIPQISSPLIGQVTGLLDRGVAVGVFRAGVDPLQLYVTIVALSCHHINNAHTLSATFGTDITSAAWRGERRRHVRQVVLSYLTDLR